MNRKAVKRTRQRYREGGLQVALRGLPRGKKAVNILAPLTTLLREGPQGARRWSLRALSQQLEIVCRISISHETVRKALLSLDIPEAHALRKTRSEAELPLVYLENGSLHRRKPLSPGTSSDGKHTPNGEKEVLF